MGRAGWDLSYLRALSIPPRVAGGEGKQTPCRTRPRGSGLRMAALQPELKETCPSLPHGHFPALGPTESSRDETHGARPQADPRSQGRSSPWGCSPHHGDERPSSASSPLSCHQSHAGTQHGRAEDAHTLASTPGRILHSSLVHSNCEAQAGVCSPGSG